MQTFNLYLKYSKIIVLPIKSVIAAAVISSELLNKLKYDNDTCKLLSNSLHAFHTA